MKVMTFLTLTIWQNNQHIINKIKFRKTGLHASMTDCLMKGKTARDTVKIKGY